MLGSVLAFAGCWDSTTQVYQWWAATDGFAPGNDRTSQGGLGLGFRRARHCLEQVLAASWGGEAETSQAYSWTPTFRHCRAFSRTAAVAGAGWTRGRAWAMFRSSGFSVCCMFNAQGKQYCPEATCQVSGHALRMLVRGPYFAHARDLWLRVSEPALLLRRCCQSFAADPDDSGARWCVPLAQVLRASSSALSSCGAVVATSHDLCLRQVPHGRPHGCLVQANMWPGAPVQLRSSRWCQDFSLRVHLHMAQQIQAPNQAHERIRFSVLLARHGVEPQWNHFAGRLQAGGGSWLFGCWGCCVASQKCSDA